MKLIFHGICGSIPKVTKPKDIEYVSKVVYEFCGANANATWEDVNSVIAKHFTSKCYGNTSCVEIPLEDKSSSFFLDAGTGLNAALTNPDSNLAKSKNIHILLSHTHWDHVFGLLSLPHLIDESASITIYGLHKNLEDRIKPLFKKENYPISTDRIKATLNFFQINPRDEEINIAGLNIKHHRLSHPGGSYAYKIENEDSNVIYATDTDGKNLLDLNQNDFFEGCKNIIFDTTFNPDDNKLYADFGHCDYKFAMQFCKEHNIPNLYMFHLSPKYTLEDISKFCSDTADNNYGVNVILPGEGTSFDL